MDYSTVSNTLVSGLTNATTGIPSIVAGLMPLLVLAIGFRIFQKLARRFSPK